jgi:membrane protein implicated in regulation of membrane protease activity
MDLTTPSLLWFLAGIVLFLLEMAVPGFILFFFGVGAWVAALGSLLFTVSLEGQILVFIVSSVLSLLVLRRFVKTAFTGDSAGAGVDMPLAATGELVEVLADIEPAREGKIKYSGTTWRARSETRISVGEVAEVVEQDGLVMVVKPLKKNEQ